MMEQRSDEWFKARLGKVTASRISDVMKKGRGNAESLQRIKYKNELIAERFTQSFDDSLTTRELRRGKELESYARDFYQLQEFNVEVKEVGFIPHPTIKNSGASPDGLVNDDGLIEIKCPNTETHIDFLKTSKPKPEYILQMQWQMMCTGRMWCDFVSYDDRLPDNLSYKCVRFHYDDKLANEIEIEVIKFLNELEEEINLIQPQ